MSVTSKLSNVNILLKNPYTAPHIPVTMKLTSRNLKELLDQFSVVYIKPDNSSQGKGILRVSRHPNGSLLLQTQGEPLKWIFTRHYPLWKKILQLKMKRPYLIQQGIPSLTISKKLFDIRTHFVRVKGEWKLGGMIGRIAHKDPLVTNAYSGGKSKKIMPLFMRELGYTEEQAHLMIQQLSDLSFEAIQTVSPIYPKWSEYGLDIGIDEQKKPWIYEINIKPGLLVFEEDKETLEYIKHLRTGAS